MYECPKCNFLQPKDKYCANCGVDIDKYLNRQVIPAHIKFIKDPVVQLSALIFGLVLFIAFVYSQSQTPDQSINTPQEILQTAPDQQPAQTPQKVKPATKKTIQKVTAKKIPPPAKKFTAASTQPIKVAAKAEGPPKEEIKEAQNLALSKLADKPEPNIALPTRLQIRFAEVSFENLQAAMTGGEEQLDSTLLRSSITTKSLEDLFPNISYLGGRKSTRLPLKSAFRASYPENEEIFGLKINLSPIDENVSPLQAQFNLNLILSGSDGASLANGGDSLGNFKVYPGKLTLLEIRLPRAKLLDSFSTKLSSTPLSIYDSQEFLEGQTTLLVVIESI